MGLDGVASEKESREQHLCVFGPHQQRLHWFHWNQWNHAGKGTGQTSVPWRRLAVVLRHVVPWCQPGVAGCRHVDASVTWTMVLLV